MATGVGRGKILMTLSNSAAKNKGINANSAQLPFKVAELYRFEIFIGCNAKFSTFASCYGNRVIRGKIK